MTIEDAINKMQNQAADHIRWADNHHLSGQEREWHKKEADECHQIAKWLSQIVKIANES